jgi:hypothetical protein
VAGGGGGGGGGTYVANICQPLVAANLSSLTVFLP